MKQIVDPLLRLESSLVRIELMTTGFASAQGALAFLDSNLYVEIQHLV